MQRSTVRSVFGGIAVLCLVAVLGTGCPKAEPPSGTQILVSYGEDLTAAERAEAMVEVRSVMDRRLRAFHFQGHEVVPAGDGKLLIKLPGVYTSTNATSARMVSGLRVELGRRGDLAFRLLHPDNATLVEEGAEAPEGYEVLEIKDADGKVLQSYYLAPAVEGLNTDSIKEAEALKAKSGGYLVSLTFDETGTAALTKFTTDNQGRTFALLIDDQVYNKLTVSEPITTGQAQIAGIDTELFAAGLTIALSSGRLPVPVTLGQPETFGTPPAAE